VHRSTPFRPPHRGRQSVRDYLTQAFADEQRIDYWHLQNGHQPPPDWDR
jgi:hypothetical protein